ncbi:Ammonium transporter 1 member 3, partial [Tetrabaena socialis]
VFCMQIGFAMGSNLVIASTAASIVVSRVAVCTALAAGSGGVSMLFYRYALTRTWDVVAVCNGVLAGLVGVTAGCSVIEPWAAIGCGAVAAVVFCLFDSFTLHTMKVRQRCSFGAYLVYSFFISSFVYPVTVHWLWDSQGWLSAFNTQHDGYAAILRTGAIDFAGSGVVHMTGGFSALMGAAIIGPRVGRFSPDGTVNEMKGHSATLVVMGTFWLWFGWFGFNP